MSELQIGDVVDVSYGDYSETGTVSWVCPEEGTVEVMFPGGSGGMFPIHMVTRQS